jgi:uncharacterized membrane protein (DUF106 family)
MNFLTKIIKSTKIDDFRTILLIFSLLVILFLAYKNYTSIDNSDLIKKLKEELKACKKHQTETENLLKQEISKTSKPSQNTQDS